MCDLFGTKAVADATNAQTALIQQEQAQQAAAIQGSNTVANANQAGGTRQIDKAFKQFTPDYFNNAKQAYLDAYNPQLTDQYNIAQDQLKSSLANRDMLESTAGANSFGLLDKTYGNAQADIGNSATDFANNLRSQVQNAKGQVEALNTGAASPYAIGTQAQAAGATVQAPSTFPSLANVFGAALSPVASAAKTNSENTGNYATTTALPFTPAPNQSSATIG